MGTIKFHTNYLIAQNDTWFCIRGGTGRWVGGGTKDWCSVVGRGQRGRVSQKGGVPAPIL